MKTNKVKLMLIAGLLLISGALSAQGQEVIYAKMAKTETYQKQKAMKTYLIEREIAEAGKLTPEQLKGISQKSNSIVADMGPGIEWVHSYVTDNKVYCVYKAQNEQQIRDHAEKGGFPVNNISELSTVIDPETGKN